MSEPLIPQKAPYEVELTPGTYWWCSCGKSKKQPFCDGSHQGSEFAPMKWTADATGKKFFCACKHTGKGPFCDGTHSKI